MSSNYEDKKKLLFDCLTSAEQCIQGTSLDQRQSTRDELSSRDHPKAVIKGRRFHGKESIFKRPEAPIGKCLRPRRVPDYQVTRNIQIRLMTEKNKTIDEHNVLMILGESTQMEKVLIRRC